MGEFVAAASTGPAQQATQATAATPTSAAFSSGAPTVTLRLTYGAHSRLSKASTSLQPQSRNEWPNSSGRSIGPERPCWIKPMNIQVHFAFTTSATARCSAAPDRRRPARGR